MCNEPTPTQQPPRQMPAPPDGSQPKDEQRADVYQRIAHGHAHAEAEARAHRRWQPR